MKFERVCGIFAGFSAAISVRETVGIHTPKAGSELKADGFLTGKRPRHWGVIRIASLVFKDYFVGYLMC